MKKFYMLVAAGIAALSMNAQDLHFLIHDQEVASGSRIDISQYIQKTEEDYGGFISRDILVDPHFFIMADKAGSITATVTCTKATAIPAMDADWMYGATISATFCGIDGSCVPLNVGSTVTKQGTLSAGQSENMQIEFMGIVGEEQTFEGLELSGECVVTCNFGGQDYELTMFFEDNGAGVDGLKFDANAPAEYFDLQGRKVTNPSAGLYIIRQGNHTTKALIK